MRLLPSKTDHRESPASPQKTRIEKSCLKCFVSTQSSLTVPRPAQHQEWKEINSDFKNSQNVILYNNRNK